MGNTPRFTVTPPSLSAAGTFVVTDNPQPANEFFRGPTSGSDAVPSFDVMNGADFPVLPTPTGILSGCDVGWSGAGLVFDISAGTYIINNVFYSYAGGSITLTASDPSNPRIDVIGFDSTGAIKITGTPAASPSEPTTDPLTEIRRTIITVAAGATIPGGGVTSTLVYNENVGPATEWTTSTNGTVDFNNTTNPYNGTKCAAVTALSTSQFIRFTWTTTFNTTSFTNLLMFVRLETALPSGITYNVALMSGTNRTTIEVNLRNFGLVGTVTGSYQAIVIPMGAFFPRTPTSGIAFDIISITRSGSGTLPTTRFDYIQLQTGINQGGGNGGGTVTSVGVSLPSIFTVTNSPVTSSGTLTATLATQTANTIFAGPTSGGAATPTFRALVAADIPFSNTTASNGLTKTVNDIALGGTATGETDIVWGSFNFNNTWNSLVTTGLNLSSNSTAASGNNQKVLGITLSGANATASQSTYGIYSSNVHTGTGSINYGGYFTADGGLVDRALAAVTTSSGAFSVYAVSSLDGTSVYALSQGNNGTAGYFYNNSATGTGYGVLGIVNGAKTTGIAGYFTATGATNNYALLVPANSGNVGFGTIAPTATRLEVVDNSLAGASMVSLTSTSTAAAGNVQKGLNISLSGTNATASQTTYALFVSNSHDGTGSSNYGVYSSVTGGATGTTAIFANASGGTSYGVNATGGSWGVYATGGIAGVQGNSSSIAVWGVGSGSGIGVQSNSENAVAFQGVRSNSSTNTVLSLINITRQSTGTAANGIGQQLDFEIQTATSSGIANSIISKWTDATHATRTSQFIITGTNSAVTADLLTISGSGATKLNKYGIKTFTGTVAYGLYEDSSGNIIEGLPGIKTVQSVTNAATITPNADTDNCVDITAIAQAFTIANATGTPTNFQTLVIRILDNAVSRAITWGSAYIDGGVTPPTATTAGKIMTVGFIYDTANSLNKWLCVSSLVQP